MDEMTAEEKAEYEVIQETFKHIYGVDGDWEKTASESIDYLLSIGIDVTGEYKDVTIEIEN